ncbi:aldehyde dehydrogenase [Tersicoccus solisilvae]|uniref:Aldehyde dehydrogenase n=1 Tax=Tersicoccus solisilvae TaxID=1882339 RepID=A0ABQ1NTI5_9MICC|nr:aldehyde dehydrogenase family protein [Tersicoccus solisilvae]GGC82400.1 aldehyde dehydrogenase [Tersicoccus solisilvae]
MTTYDVFDPATLELVGQAPLHGADDVDVAVTRAVAAGPGWAADRGARRAALRGAAEALRAKAPEIGRRLSLEQGKVLREAVGEVLVAADVFDYYAALDWDEEETLPDRQGRSLLVQRRPVGVVAAITPWNFPISLLSVKLAPALVAGCTVIAKPSPTTPLSTIALIETVAAFTPTGVVQWLTGRRAVNKALSEHPRVRKISFTGSTEVGAAIAAQAAPTVKRVTLELGGNDPAIVLPDADAAFTAAGVVGSAFRNAGQVCMAVKRVFVPADRAREMVDAIAAEAARLTVGHGVDEGTTMGPMHSRSQLELVEGLVRDAVDAGGRLATGGGRGTSLPGYFLEPTVVADAAFDSPLVAREQFGAALPVVAYTDLDDLLARLNAQEFGLGASVWSPDLDRAELLATRIEAGTVWINQHTQVELDAPFGGWKASGIGRERGPFGLEPYLELRTINARAHAPAVSPTAAVSTAR